MQIVQNGCNFLIISNKSINFLINSKIEAFAAEEEHEHRPNGLRRHKQRQNLHNPRFKQASIRSGAPLLQAPAVMALQRQLQILLQLPLDLQLERAGPAERQAEAAQPQHLLRPHRQGQHPLAHQDRSVELPAPERTHRCWNTGARIVIQQHQ